MCEERPSVPSDDASSHQAIKDKLAPSASNVVRIATLRLLTPSETKLNPRKPRKFTTGGNDSLFPVSFKCVVSIPLPLSRPARGEQFVQPWQRPLDEELSALTELGRRALYSLKNPPL